MIAGIVEIALDVAVTVRHKQSIKCFLRFSLLLLGAPSPSGKNFLSGPIKYDQIDHFLQYSHFQAKQNNPSYWWYATVDRYFLFWTGGVFDGGCKSFRSVLQTRIDNVKGRVSRLVHTAENLPICTGDCLPVLQVCRSAAAVCPHGRVWSGPQNYTIQTSNRVWRVVALGSPSIQLP